MNTITIQIGNSDDRLTQKEWKEFCFWVDMEVRARGEVHFYGCSPSDAEWQNACWVANVEDYDIENLKHALTRVGKHFRQDSIAWTVGTTEFLGEKQNE